MLKRKKKEIVGQRQIYRRIADAVDSPYEQIIRNSNFIKNIPLKLDDNQIIIDNSISFTVDNSTTNNVYNLEDSSNLYSNFTEILDENVNSINLNVEAVIVPKSLSNELALWTVKHKIPRCAVTDLLHILHPYHAELPFDSRTLLKTPVSINVVQLDNGQLCYFGILTYLKYLIENFDNLPDTFDLIFNVDGIPLFKNSNIQLWPILGQIQNVKSNPFVVAVFCGISKLL